MRKTKSPISSNKPHTRITARKRVKPRVPPVKSKCGGVLNEVEQAKRVMRLMILDNYHL